MGKTEHNIKMLMRSMMAAPSNIPCLAQHISKACQKRSATHVCAHTLHMQHARMLKLVAIHAQNTVVVYQYLQTMPN